MLTAQCGWPSVQGFHRLRAHVSASMSRWRMAATSSFVSCGWRALSSSCLRLSHSDSCQ
jgi:hypothetical protein